MSASLFRQRQRPAWAVFALALIAALAAASCADDATPQLDVQVQLDLPESVAPGEPLDIGFAWTMANEFEAPADDYQVFVHMIDQDGNILLQDDHYPPQPTSQWRAGQAEEYRHWYDPPDSLQAEYLDFVIGLYSLDSRVRVRDPGGNWTEGVQLHRITVRADDVSGIPLYMEGWHPPEQQPDPGVREWRWSEETSRAVFTNPRRDAVLHLRAHGPFDEVGTQTVVLRIGDGTVANIDVSSADEFLERIAIPAAAMGENEWVELNLEVTPVMVPKEIEASSMDDRQLGLQVFSMYLSSS
jgi:hypothetical protein